jgi:hypothetical protein
VIETTGKKMLRILTLVLCLCGLFFNTSHAEASDQKTTGMKGLVNKLAGKAAMKGIEKAGLLHCPQGQKCYCLRPTQSAGYKAECKYLDKDRTFHTARAYDDAKTCTILCLGKRIESANEGVDIKGKEEYPGKSKSEPAPAAAKCDMLPYPNGEMVSCCGSKGTSGGKRVCLNKDAPKQ